MENSNLLKISLKKYINQFGVVLSELINVIYCLHDKHGYYGLIIAHVFIYDTKTYQQGNSTIHLYFNVINF